MATRQRALRSDAQRNREGILDAALTLFADDAGAGMAAIAEAAGVGRVTLYGHFASRHELVEALFTRTLERADAALGTVDLSGRESAALERLTASSWRIVDAFHALLGVAENELPPERIAAHVDTVLARVRSLIERGQASGEFRDDLDAGWLTECYFAVLHGAARRVRSGAMDESDASAAVPLTVLALVRRPDL